MRALTLTLLSLLALFAAAPPTVARQRARQPAFTLKSRVTVYTDDGRTVVFDEMRYVSSSGAFRVVRTQEDGTVYDEKVFEPGRGFLSVRHDYELLVRGRPDRSETSDEPPPTAEQLRASPRFAHTEVVLGRTTYIHSYLDERTGLPAADYYFAPELGRFPLKTVLYKDGRDFSVWEPVSVTLGEPDPAQLKAPNYEVSDLAPISGGVLNGKVVEKAQPSWPQDAQNASGPVTVQVLVNESGKVVKAKAVSGPEQLRQAAVDAALRTRLSPTKLSGKPVKLVGVLVYKFDGQ